VHQGRAAPGHRIGSPCEEVLAAPNLHELGETSPEEMDLEMVVKDQLFLKNGCTFY
jgi:hypothetical protein